MVRFILILWCAFAWAWGGEHGFGKYRRGFLLLPAFFVAGIVYHMPLWYYFAQFLLAYGIYQTLFYDSCIDALYDRKEKLLGIIGLFVNGFLTGAQPALIYSIAGEYAMAFWAMVFTGFFFVFTMWLTNRWKIKLPFCLRLGEVGILCPQDSSWFGFFIFGAFLGGLI